VVRYGVREFAQILTSSTDQVRLKAWPFWVVLAAHKAVGLGTPARRLAHAYCLSEFREQSSHRRVRRIG
jgi:hypothetical protein